LSFKILKMQPPQDEQQQQQQSLCPYPAETICAVCKDIVPCRQCVKQDSPNNGRWFYSHNQCKFFIWADAPTTTTPQRTSNKRPFSNTTPPPPATNPCPRAPVKKLACLAPKLQRHNAVADLKPEIIQAEAEFENRLAKAEQLMIISSNLSRITVAIENLLALQIDRVHQKHQESTETTTTTTATSDVTPLKVVINKQ
jgi:hypothetical protein